MHFRHASAEAKLQWLEEANAFVRQFVAPDKQERWREFIESGENGQG